MDVFGRFSFPQKNHPALCSKQGGMDTYGVYGHQMEGEMLETANIIDDVFSHILDS